MTDPGVTPKMLEQQLGIAKADAAAVVFLVKALQIHIGVVDADDENQVALLVLQKQVLGMAAWQFLLDLVAFVDGEDGFMFVGFCFNAQISNKSNRSCRDAAIVIAFVWFWWLLCTGRGHA